MKTTLSEMFKYQNYLVMVGWLVLMCLPFWQYMPSIVMAIILTISATYAYYIFFGRRYDDGARSPTFKDFGSLKGVSKMFTNPRVVLGGWLHYLAFDLLVGLMILMDSQQHDISYWFIAPILLFSLMIGPSGLLIYFVFRAFYTGNIFDLSFVL